MGLKGQCFEKHREIESSYIYLGLATKKENT